MNKQTAAQEYADDLRIRTKRYALRIIKLFQSLPKTGESKVLGHQLLRSGTSVGAHYRESCRARSTAEFISKIEVALQELDESSYWIELLIEAELVPKVRLESLLTETEELIAILTASVKTAKSRKKGT